MTFPDPLCVVMTTTADCDSAERLGRALLAARLAACVQYEEIRSQYVWQGEVCTDSEVRLVIKTLASRCAALEAMILDLHDYECPQIVRLEGQGSAGYEAWLRDVLHEKISHQ